MTVQEKRRFRRFPFVAEIRYRSNSPPVMARITDLSEGGIFIDTVTPLVDGMQVTFSFYIPDNFPDIAVSGSGKVAWEQPTVGMGIEFVKVDDVGRNRIRKYLEKL